MNITLTLTPADLVALDAFLLAENTGETRQALVTRLAVKSLQVQLDGIRQREDDRTRARLLTGFLHADEATRAAALALLPVPVPVVVPPGPPSIP